MFFGQRSKSDLPLSVDVKPSPDDTGRLKAFTGQSERRRFGRYETLFRIAGGGMAEVYAARILGEGGFEKVVALKRMLPTLAEDERFVSMFLDEGRVAAHISSPNVVQTLDLGRADDDSLYLVMELVVGVPLGHLIRGVLKNGEFVDLGIAVEIIAQAATGLHDAHEATTPMGDPLKLIHRDISPQNILVDRTGRTRITDFGVARAMQSHSHTQTGELKGKMAYFAPEQAKGGLLTSRVDIFALGIVAWELITARRLFKSDNPLNTLRKVLDEPIPTVHEYRDGVPEALGACITKALQREPENRYESARAFAQALRAAITPAPQSAVGEYVKLHGEDSLEPLVNGLKRALGNEPDDEETRVASRRPESTSGISTSAIVPSGSLSGSHSGSHSGTGSRALALNAVDSAGLRPTAAPKRFGLLFVALAVAMVGVTFGVFFALRPTTSSTALQPLAAPPEVIPEPLPEPVNAVVPTVIEPTVVEPTEPELVAEPEPERNPRTTMRGRGMATGMATMAAAATEVVEPTVEEPPSMMGMTSAAMEPATMETVTMNPVTMNPVTMDTPSEGGETSEMSGSSMGLLMPWGEQ